MINRRNIRAKVMQQLYSLDKTGEKDLQKAAKDLEKNLQNIYKLYLLLLDLWVAIRDAEADLLERRRRKFFKSEEDINPNYKFVNNRVLKQLADNEVLRSLVEKYKLDRIWNYEKELVHYFLEKIKQSDYYKRYMASDEDSFDEDKKFIMDVYKNIIAPDKKLHTFLEDWEINWADDMAVANTMVMKTLSDMQEKDSKYKKLPDLYKNEGDEKFGRDLLFKTFQNKDKLSEMIKDKTINWDWERISHVDKLLMMMALAEFLYFPEIPETATMNEYVELAKEYSTPKSNSFINGILDKIYKELKQKNQINKI